MKRILLSMATLLSMQAMAQTVMTENFNGATLPGIPTGWSQKNLDGLTTATNLSAFNFGTNAWVSRNRNTATGDKMVASTSWYTPAGTSNDWLVSPQIAIPNANNYFAIFEAVASSSQFNDGFTVKISTTDTAVASFATTIMPTTVASTTGFTEYAINLSAYAGQNVYIAIINNSNDKELLYVDNFTVKRLPTADAAVLSITPTKESRPSFVPVSGSGNVGGVIKNLGANNISAINISYNDGTSTFNMPLTGLNIAPYTTYTFNHTTPVGFSTVSTKKLNVWATLSGDANILNDSANTSMNGYSTKPTYKIAFEEGTGTWCGWCPRGAVYMDSMAKTYGDKVTLVAVHNNDPMVVNLYDAGLGGLIGGYPSSVASREAEIDPSDMPAYYNQHKDDYGYGEVGLTSSITGTSINGTITFKPASNLEGNYRTAFVVTEDHVIGASASYAQANYYSSTSSNQDLIYEGQNWKNKSNPVAATDMVYDHVARFIADAFEGSPNSLPTPMTGGSTYTKSYSWTIPATSRPWLLHAVAMVINNDNGVVCNSTSAAVLLNVATQIKDVNNVICYPNPATNNINVQIDAIANSNINIVITNNLGQVVKTVNNVNVAAGTSTQNLDITTLNSGLYNVSIFNAQGKVTIPVQVNR